MVNTSRFNRGILCGTICALLSLPASAALDGYWPLNETEGIIAPNAVDGGIEALLFNGATWVTDATRGRVLEFDGVDAYADAGVLPALGLNSDFTWSFWSLNNQDPSTNVIIGNRYAPGGGEFSPREFTKFTNQQFEWHHDGIGENIDYPDLTIGTWVHNTVVKDGNLLISYQDGLVKGFRTITGGIVNQQPFYFGGNQTLENWAGRLDDVAVWSNALPATSVVGVANGKYTPSSAPLASAPVMQTVFSEDFSAGLEGKWSATNRGLEQNAPAGYNEPAVTDGKLTLGGITGLQYWYGSSLETNERFSSLVETTISVDRISLEGTGTAVRSSLWILGDDAHYLHFSQNFGEAGWSWNARDDNGLGTLNPIGGGNNIALLDSFDSDLSEHEMKLQLIPTGTPGEVNLFLYFDDQMVAAHSFTAFPEDFQVVLTGQARAIGDSVNAVFDNVLVQQVPEPSTAALLLLGAATMSWRRRRTS